MTCSEIFASGGRRLNVSNTVSVGNACGFYTVDRRHEVTESQRSTRFAVGNAERLTVGLLDRKRHGRDERSRRMRITDDYGAGAADYDVTMRSDSINQSCVFPVDKNGR